MAYGSSLGVFCVGLRCLCSTRQGQSDGKLQKPLPDRVVDTVWSGVHFVSLPSM